MVRLELHIGTWSGLEFNQHTQIKITHMILMVILHIMLELYG